MSTDAISNWRLRRERVPDFSVAGVYKQKNAHFVASLIQGLDDIRLWALDGVSPELSSVTVGSGPGSRTELLNRLTQDAERPYTVLIDDDIEFLLGDIRRIVMAAARHDLDLCQPAQSHTGYASHQITCRRRFSGLRITNFVESGPLLVIADRFRHHVLPFPEDSGFGWGLDVRWSALAEQGARFGILDASTIRHLNPAGAAYPDRAAERARLDAALTDVGADSIDSLAKTRQVVRPWKL